MPSSFADLKTERSQFREIVKSTWRACIEPDDESNTWRARIEPDDESDVDSTWRPCIEPDGESDDGQATTPDALIFNPPSSGELREPQLSFSRDNFAR